MGDLFGVGALAGAAASLLFGIWAGLRSSKATRTAANTVQVVETIREFIKTLPNGQTYDLALLQWIQKHQKEAGVTELVVELLGKYVSNPDAKVAAGGPADIVNSDQGSQFTSAEWMAAVQAAGMQVSHDGRGRALDNVMVERLWRTVKYEDIYLRDYGDLLEARTGLNHYFRFYNRERPHQGLDYRTPWEVLTGTPTTSREGTGNGLCAPSPFRFKMGWEENRKNK